MELRMMRSQISKSLILTREDMFVDAPEELNFDTPNKEALMTDDDDNGDQFNNEKEDREKELAVLQEKFKLLTGENDLKGEDGNTVEIVSRFSKFLKTAEEEKTQHEDALRELREIISGKDDEIDDLTTKISELSSSQLVSGHQSHDEEQLEAATYRIMLTLSNVFGQEELQYGSSCRQSTSFATICPGLAKKLGDSKLAQICGTIAADEKRHETAYTKIVEKLFEIDPDTTVVGFADMMKKKISMPAHLMYDGRDDNLFEHFSSVAQRLGVYTARDYADILEFLVRRWNVENLAGLSGEGRRAQDYLCRLPPRIRKLEERAQGRVKEAARNIPFSWIFGREIRA